MSEFHKANTDHPYFITMTIVGWIDLFSRERYCEQIIDSLRFCTKKKELRLFEYVIMPSHIHLIAQNLNGNLPAVLRDMKSFLANEFLNSVNEPGESRSKWLKSMFAYYARETKQNRKFMLWKKTNHPLTLDTPQLFAQKAHYIVMNPVAAGYVTDETAWKYSSAGKFSPLKLTEDGGMRD